MTKPPETNVDAASAELSTIDYLKANLGVGRWTELEDGKFKLEIGDYPMSNLGSPSPYDLLSTKLAALNIGYQLETSPGQTPAQRSSQSVFFTPEAAGKIRTALVNGELSTSNILGSRVKTPGDGGPTLPG
jgi:hypothetical protein